MASSSTSTAVYTPQTTNIPLRRLVSRNSIFKRTASLLSTSATATLPDYTSPPDYASINTTTTNASLLPPPSSTQDFNPTTTLQIQTLGKAAISFPLTPKELEIPVYNLDDERTGLKYLSIRATRRSGSCVLKEVGNEMQEEMQQVANTTYHFGSLRNPVICIDKTLPPVADGDGDVLESANEGEVDEFEVQSKSIFNRTIFFESNKWGRFEWRYAGRRERALADPSGKKSIHNLLVLEKVVETGDREERTKVAQLIRSGETRTPGSGKSCAGNGGRLEMCLGEGPLTDEVTVVVTCLVMLKKEIDRLRAMQIAAMYGGGGC